ncbi:zinc ABC transporter ATP-binding protein [Spirochaetia bacterium]|nr:zinc ABC transporter ATP-binding protein [Spirochaetia bacterium]GHU30362.1 zinc ABC transporter ATP-binding protein [Spirochaetia bacterium]
MLLISGRHYIKPLISLINAGFGYAGIAVTGALNCNIYPGDYLCIVGENGSGKSTLLKGLLGLIAPLSGNITKDSGLSGIGYLPQLPPERNDFPAGVFEIVLSGTLQSRGFFPFYRPADKQKAEEVLVSLGIMNLRNCCYRELSGGQQRRVLLARALCASQNILILDEPAAGLDPLVTADLYATIETINKKSGITIVMVSHDIERAVHYANQILHLHHKNYFFGTTEEYLRSDFAQKFLIKGEDSCLTF